MKDTAFTTVVVSKCWVVNLDDYQDFDYALDLYRMSGLKAAYEEIGLFKRKYLAVFYVGDKDYRVQEMIDEIKKNVD